MIRYKKTISIHTNRNGEITLQTDMGQTWKTTPVKEKTQFSEWLWAHHTILREYQRDFLQIIHQAFNPLSGMHDIQLYWVYKQGQGFKDQSTDIAFARLESANVWILMTPQNTWMVENALENFNLEVSESLGPVTDESVKDELWNFHDEMLNIRAPKKKYTDADYQAKGLGV